jgi:predicted nucleotidyltransferase
MDNRRAHEAITEYRKGLQALFREQLVAVMLYGSQARGEANEDSDIDILCIIREPFDYAQMIQQTSELNAMVSLKYDVVISRVFVSEDDYRNRTLPFLMNIRREGVQV